MKLIIDADACPVIAIAEKAAKEYRIPLLLICDTSHELTSAYGTVMTVDKGADSADFRIIQTGSRGDLVITQDYGVASMALGKGMRVLHQSGMEYTNENIDRLMFERHMAKKLRMGGKIRQKGPKKRTKEDDVKFAHSLYRILSETVY
ncbi:MAG TPA: YaiI/YqxD family protein [Lachnospiraceae bacterium]|nr:YaiI/YqxD family protein [Lachnospiraceae bacterium]